VRPQRLDNRTSGSKPRAGRISMRASTPAPVILGWKGWCDLAHRYEIAALAAYLEAVVAKSATNEQPLEMAHVLLGALNTAARVIATSSDPKKARVQVEETIQRLLKGLGY
jgi:hypothetical protein